MANAGRVLTRDVLIDRIWGPNYFGDTKTLDVHVKRLRSKIEAGLGPADAHRHRARRRLPLRAAPRLELSSLRGRACGRLGAAGGRRRPESRPGRRTVGCFGSIGDGRRRALRRRGHRARAIAYCVSRSSTVLRRRRRRAAPARARSSVDRLVARRSGSASGSDRRPRSSASSRRRSRRAALRVVRFHRACRRTGPSVSSAWRAPLRTRRARAACRGSPTRRCRRPCRRCRSRTWRGSRSRAAR